MKIIRIRRIHDDHELGKKVGGDVGSTQVLIRKQSFKLGDLK